MKRNLTFLFVGIFVGVTICAACTPFFKKTNRMYIARENITAELGTEIHITNRDDERLFERQIIIPKGACLNDDGSCFEVKFLKLNVTLNKSEVPRYFKEGRIEGNYFMNYRMKG